MAHKVVRTTYSMYQMLILFLAIILYCDGRVFDGLGDDNEIFTQDIEMPPGVFPVEDDAYMCTSVQMPRQDAYIVNFVPHAAMEKVHHMLLYGCHDTSPGVVIKVNSNCVMDVCKGKSTIMFAWARVVSSPMIPRGVGFHVGGDSNINYITLQIHYKDAFTANEEPDHSGIELSMTYIPQPYLAGIYLMVSEEANIQPHSHNVYADLACGYTDPVPIYPFAFHTHAHELVKVITGYLIKGDSKGTWLEIAKGDPHWAQAFYPMQPGITKVEQGDWLIARCTFSSDRDTITNVRPTRDDEICNLSLMYYTDAKYGKPFSMCSSPATDDIRTHFPDS